MTIVVYRSTELFGTSACKVCCVGIVVSTATASSTRPSPASSAVVVLSTWFGTHGYVVALSQQTWIVESAVEKDVWRQIFGYKKKEKMTHNLLHLIF